LSTYLPTLISWLQQYGYPALGLSVFVAAIGVPLPITLVLLAAGAFAALGDFNIALLAVITIMASVCGDSVGYLVGKQVGARLITWLEVERNFYLISPLTITRSRTYFHKHGAWAIFLSRFLISALGGAINLLAGAEIYPYSRFLLYDAGGEAVGAILPLSFGYAFGASWEAVGDVIGNISLFLVALLIVVYLIQRLLRMAQRVKVAKAVHARPLEDKRKILEEFARESPDHLPP
jgi:membrane-associated protein